MSPKPKTSGDPKPRLRNARITLRKFLLSGLGISAVSAFDARCVEPEWLQTTHHRLGDGTTTPTHRFVHITDIHHKGDRPYLEKVVREVNALSPDFVRFTGDLLEDASHLPETLELLGKIKSPLYGVPGNHDYWAEIDFDTVARAFASTGGAWLMDQSLKIAHGKINLIGAACQRTDDLQRLAPDPSVKNILLLHYPAWIKSLKTRFDLMLAGHSHGGQVRLPFYGALVVPYHVDQYELGMYHTPAGPLYVGAGIGYFYVNWRFRCRPEIAVFEI